MRLEVHVGLDMRFLCVQCQREMSIQGGGQHVPEPVLVCPGCGFKVQVRQTQGLPGVPAGRGRFPALKPRRV